MLTDYFLQNPTHPNILRKKQHALPALVLACPWLPIPALSLIDTGIVELHTAFYNPFQFTSKDFLKTFHFFTKKPNAIQFCSMIKKGEC